MRANQEPANKAVHEAPIATQTVEQLAVQLAEARFRELVTEHALLNGVRPAAIRHVVRDAAEIFELKDDALVPRNNATDPGDPLTPLSPARWLEQLRASDGYLFAPPTRTH